ncbi:MAG: tRNA-binding protein [Rhodospirillaceae bacterium]|nr:tRNA-binding protein [Rhodospirillaceae bacterium]|tara:strand:+ start:983 stop:1339 length:357 start_codon:yes stop_codon:yes gene_type:complete
MENSNKYEVIEYEEFQRVEIRVGTIVDVREFPEARQPALKLWVDFGEKFGVRKTSAQVSENYEIGDLIDRQVAAVINFPPKQIGKFMSEILVLGFPDEAGDVVLVNVDKPVPNGGRLF